MKVEAGKRYNYRDGGVSAPLEPIGGDNTFLFDSCSGYVYGCNEEHGHLVFPPIFEGTGCVEHPNDLMSEA